MACWGQPREDWGPDDTETDQISFPGLFMIPFVHSDAFRRILSFDIASLVRSPHPRGYRE